MPFYKASLQWIEIKYFVNGLKLLIYPILFGQVAVGKQDWQTTYFSQIYTATILGFKIFYMVRNDLMCTQQNTFKPIVVIFQYYSR